VRAAVAPEKGNDGVPLAFWVVRDERSYVGRRVPESLDESIALPLALLPAFLVGSTDSAYFAQLSF
jgi:hypothetical protein